MMLMRAVPTKARQRLREMGRVGGGVEGKDKRRRECVHERDREGGGGAKRVIKG